MTTSPDPQQRAIAILRMLNRQTNMLLAGTRASVLGEGDVARALESMLSGMGVRPGGDLLLLAPGIEREGVLEHVLAQRPAHSTTLLCDPERVLSPVPFEPGTSRVERGGISSGLLQTRELVVIGTDARPSDDAAARVRWARAHMAVTSRLADEFRWSGQLRQMRIGVSLVIEPKTAVLALELQRAGAEVQVFAPAAEADPEIVALLRSRGVVVHSSPEAASEAADVEALLAFGPELLIDDGAHIIRRAHERPGGLVGLRGAAEETTSGVRPLRAMAAEGELAIPVIAVNDARAKSLFDNRHGTGQTCVFAILDLVAEHADVLGREPDAPGTWLVIGYGPVGEGTARHARAIGADVIVAELDPVRALAAECDGLRVAPLEQGLAQAEFVVSATGIAGTVDPAHLRQMRSGAVIAVAGGVDHEVRPPESRQARGRGLEEIADEAGNRAWLLSAGHGINYTAGEGNPIEIMDLSFAAQLSALARLLRTPALAAGVHPLDPVLDERIARLALETRGSAVDAAPEADGAGEAWRDDRYRRGSRPGSEHGEPEIRETTVYSARLVIPVAAPRIRDGAVAVRDGRIVHIGERSWVVNALREAGDPFQEEHWPGIIAPGLVNAHTHLQYTDMAPVAERRYHGFEDWMVAFDEVYDAGGQDWRAAAARGAAELIRTGTTAAADVVTDAEAATALHDAGLHGIAYWEVLGWSNADWNARGKDQTLAELAAIPDSPGIGVSPHAPYSLEVQPLLDVPDMVRNMGMRLHIHLAEARMESERGTLDESWYQSQPASFRALRAGGSGLSSTQFVDHLGVLGPDCHIAHGVYMTARDRSLLRARGTSVALCPRSNEVIGLDMPPIADYLREGNLLSVGTDSLSSSPSLDLLADVGLLYRVARDQGYGERDLHQRLLHAATLGGAGALGLGVGRRRAGQLSVGAQADLAFFEIDEADQDEAMAHLVEAGAGTCRRTVIAGLIKHDEISS